MKRRHTTESDTDNNVNVDIMPSRAKRPRLVNTHTPKNAPHPYVPPAYHIAPHNFALFHRLPREISCIIMAHLDALDVLNMFRTNDHFVQMLVQMCYNTGALDTCLYHEPLYANHVSLHTFLNHERSDHIHRWPSKWKNLYNVVTLSPFPRILHTTLIRNNMWMHIMSKTADIIQCHQKNPRNAQYAFHTTHLFNVKRMIPMSIITHMPLVSLALQYIECVNITDLQALLPHTTTKLDFINVNFEFDDHDDPIARFPHVQQMSFYDCSMSVAHLRNQPSRRLLFDIRTMTSCNIRTRRQYGPYLTICDGDSPVQLQRLSMYTYTLQLYDLVPILVALRHAPFLSTLSIHYGAMVEVFPHALTSLTFMQNDMIFSSNLRIFDNLPSRLLHLNCHLYFLELVHLDILPRTLLTLEAYFELNHTPVTASWMPQLKVLHVQGVRGSSPAQVAFLQSAAHLPSMRECTGIPRYEYDTVQWSDAVQVYGTTLMLISDTPDTAVAPLQTPVRMDIAVNLVHLEIHMAQSTRLDALPPNLTTLYLDFTSYTFGSTKIYAWTSALKPLQRLRHLAYKGWTLQALRRDLVTIRTLPLETLSLTSCSMLKQLPLSVFDQNLPGTLKVFACLALNISIPGETQTSISSQHGSVATSATAHWVTYDPIWDWLHLPPALESIVIGTQRENAQLQTIMLQQHAKFVCRTNLHVHVYCQYIYDGCRIYCQQCGRHDIIKHHVQGIAVSPYDFD